MQFNAFLQGKVGTQALRGGNSEIFYDTEGSSDLKGVKGTNYNPVGTVRKTLNLTLVYPEVTKEVWRYGRIHHHVDYRKYRANPLIRRKGVSAPTGVNDYGMKLVTMTAEEVQAQKDLESSKTI